MTVSEGNNNISTQNYKEVKIVEAYKVVKTFEVRGSQNLIKLSLLPETNNPLVGCHLTHFTSHP